MSMKCPPATKGRCGEATLRLPASEVPARSDKELLDEIRVIDITASNQAQAELVVANRELALQNEEKEKRAAELVVANKELVFQNEEKEKRAAELVVANKELVFQNEEKEKRAAELVVANRELALQNEEKEKRAAELVVANKELAFQNEEKEKRAAELVVALDAVEVSNRAKTIFLSNMSHELRTPMNGILGMAQVLQETELSQEQGKFVQIILQSSNALLTILKDVLDFSKIEAERLPMEAKIFSLSLLINDAITVQEIVAQAKGLTLIREIPATFPDQFSGDAFRLRQILLNFLGNACKFSDQGTITVRVSAVEQDDESVLVRIEVEDQGIGISHEQQARLFQAFTQVDGSVTRKYGGSGLGLVISKRLANLMGGDAGVVSQEGQGSTFWATVRLKLTKVSQVGI